MIRALAFCAGILAAGMFPHIPPVWAIPILVLLAAPCFYRKIFHCPAYLLIGMAYGLFSGQQMVDQQLAPSLEGQEVVIIGTVSDLPVDRDNRQRFQFSVERSYFSEVELADADIAGEKVTEEGLSETGKALKTAEVPETILLSWYNQDSLKVGQRWQLLVKLKRPRGFVNQGGFDYQRWLLSRGVGATGYVRDSSNPKRELNQQLESESDFALFLPLWRQNLRDWLLKKQEQEQEQDNSGETDLVGPLLALVVGDSSYISNDQWQVFQSTGTSHLMAISGLHIGLVALLGFWIGHGLRAVTSLVVSKKPYFYFFPGIFSILLAAFYAAIAGFALPTQRALVMVMVVNLALLVFRHVAITTVFTFALVAVLLIDPLAGFEPGFWLSFGAVAVLCWSFYGRNTERPSNNVKKIDAKQTDINTGPDLVSYTKRVSHTVFGKLCIFSKSQLVVFVGLSLPLLALNLSPSVVGPVANFFAIPITSFAIVIPLLMSALSIGVNEHVAQFYFSIAETSMEYLWVWLSFLDNWQQSTLSTADVSMWPGTPSWLSLIIGLIGITILMAPRGLPARYLGLILLLPTFFPIFSSSMSRDSFFDEPSLRVTVLEVGQGLSVVVRTEHQTLVYDAGPEFSERFNAGDAIVGSYLRSQGIKKIDTLIISHADLDHAGGAVALASNLPVGQWIVGENIDGVDKNVLQPCQSYPAWKIDGVDFQFLSTEIQSVTAKNNNRSCVLLIKWQNHSALLTGDIERVVERRLLTEQKFPSDVDLLIAPHHGSATSSSPAFVKHIAARVVVFSAGYNNRYGHPHPKVVARYRHQGAQLLSTAHTGQIDVEWYGNEPHPIVRLRREDKPRFWYPNDETDITHHAR